MRYIKYIFALFLCGQAFAQPLDTLRGGTGVSSLKVAINKGMPTQTGNSGKVLITDGTNIAWVLNTGGVSSVTASSPLFSSGGATPNLTIQSATTSQNGALTATDW